MFKVLKISGLVIVLVLLNSCFKEIPYPNIEGNKQYVINCIFEINTSPVAKVYQTAILGSNSVPEIFSEAQLLLYDSLMGKIDSFAFNPISKNYTCNTICSEKNKYYLVFKNNNAIAKAKEALVSAQINYSIDTQTIIFRGKEDFLQVKLTISDEINIKNYYSFQLLRSYWEYSNNDSAYKEELQDLETIDYWFLRNENSQFTKKELLLRDLGFEDKVAMLRFGAFNLFTNTSSQKTIAIKLISSKLSPNLYQYRQTINEHLFYQTDPFAQSTSVYTNWDNIRGIFASKYSDTTYLYKQ